MSEIRKKRFVEWYTKYGTPAKMGLYFNALSDPNHVLDFRANHPARPELHQDVDRALFPPPGHSIYEYTDVNWLRILFDNSSQLKVADDGSLKAGIGNYALWLRMVDPEPWLGEEFWDGDCVTAGTPTGRTRMATLLKNGFDYLRELENRKVTYRMDKYIAALSTKPFILLAGISGTGKSRLVRQLARGFCPANSPLSTNADGSEVQKPGNFEMIPVRPNWHDSTELLGYVTRITEDSKPQYVLTPLVKFLVKAWMNPTIPFFLCLDEMNLAPVEQYFAEYLSVIETRKWVDAADHAKGIASDVFVRFDVAQSKDATGKATTEQFVLETVERLMDDHKAPNGGANTNIFGATRKMMCDKKGIPLPPNLVVMGTVNMDETTCSFSRKVLDRAMTFELNDVSSMYTVDEIQQEGDIPYGSIPPEQAKVSMLSAKDAVAADAENAKKILAYIKAVNDKLEDTPFKIAYRSRDEIMIYCLERIKSGVVELPQALDEATSMKILSRIEGDNDKLAAYKLDGNGKKVRDEDRTLLDVLAETISAALKTANGGTDPSPACDVCAKKLEFMKARLDGGFTNFFV